MSSNNINLNNIIKIIGSGKRKRHNSTSSSKTSGALLCLNLCLCLCLLLSIGCSIAVNVITAEEPKPTDGEYISDNSIKAEWYSDTGEKEPPLDQTVTLTFITNSIFIGLNKVYKKIRVKKGSVYKFDFWDVPFALPFTAVGWSEQRFLGGENWYLKKDQTYIDVMNKTSIGVNSKLIPPYQVLYVVGMDSYIADRDTTFYAIWGKWRDAFFTS